MKDDLKGTEYVIVEEETECDEYGNVVSYGIAAKKDGRKLDEVNDISLDRETVKRLAEMFNELELSIVHFRDVLEDLLP